MVSVGSVAPVANDLEPAEHLADREEADHLGGDNADLLQSGGVHVANAREERLGVARGGRTVEESGRVLESLRERLEVGLDGLHVAVKVSLMGSLSSKNVA